MIFSKHSFNFESSNFRRVVCLMGIQPLWFVLINFQVLISHDFQEEVVDEWERIYENRDDFHRNLDVIIYPPFVDSSKTPIRIETLIKGLIQNDSPFPGEYKNYATELLFRQKSDLDSCVLLSFKPELYLYAGYAVDVLRQYLEKNCFFGGNDGYQCAIQVEATLNNFNINYNLKTVEEVLDQYHRLKAEGFENIIEDFKFNEE